MAVISVPSSSLYPTSLDVPGDGAVSGVVYVKTGKGVQPRFASGIDVGTFIETGRGALAWSAGGSKVPTQPYVRKRLLGGRYDTSAAVTCHVLRAVPTKHQPAGAIRTHMLRVVFVGHSLRGDDG